MGLRDAPSVDLRCLLWCAQVNITFAHSLSCPLPLHCRNLGRHISFVQGLFNDEWSEDSLSAFLSSQGNELRNSQLLEYHVPPSFRKPNASSERGTREVYITAKCACRRLQLLRAYDAC
jgi:hypothetical protein